MGPNRPEPEPQARKRDRQFLIGLLVLALATLVDVARVVDQHSIQVVAAGQLLPRWDLATHLDHGWEDYHLLVTGRIDWLLWDLWLQGYWPPVLSVWQIPFYLVFGGHIAAGLRSALGAFVSTGVLGCVLMWQQWRSASLLPAAIFLALLLSSPYILAYASVTMTEMAGAAAQLVVLIAYVACRQRSTPSTARALAISLTVLFFTKYNYFILLIVPLVIYEWMDSSARGGGTGERPEWMRLAFSSPTVWLLAAYVAVIVAVTGTGGFEFHAGGRRISVHTIGNSGYVVLYCLLARLWYLHRRGRIPWQRIMTADSRVGSLVVWFVIPLTIWFATPYPNHIRDFFNLVINRPLGESTVAAGVDTYVDALRHAYFENGFVLAIVVIVFVIAAARFRTQPPLMKWLILAIPLQFTVIALHQTRFPRFLLLTVVLLCVAAAGEVGRWFAGSRSGRIAGFGIALIVLATGILAARRVVTQDRFRAIAFENYTDNQTLRGAIDTIRDELKPDDRLAVIGESNELSPALLRWELGRPSGFACSPFELGGAKGAALAAATKILLMMPMGPEPAVLDITSYYLAQRQAVLEEVARGTFRLRHDIPVPDRHLSLRTYDRTSAPAISAPCR